MRSRRCLGNSFLIRPHRDCLYTELIDFQFGKCTTSLLEVLTGAGQVCVRTGLKTVLYIPPLGTNR